MDKEVIPEDQDEFDDEEMDEEFVNETEKIFEEFVWKQLKHDIKELSKHELAKQMFVSGAVMYKEHINQQMEHPIREMQKNPEQIKEVVMGLAKGSEGKEEDSLWAEGGFIQSMNPNEMEEKMKTFHQKHDEDVNYSCKGCGTKISAHNRD